MSIKDAVDIDKPYFDYINNILKLGGWFLGVAYVVNWLVNHEHRLYWTIAPWSWLGIASAILIGNYLLLSVLRTAIAIMKVAYIDARLGGVGKKVKFLFLFVVIGWGTPIFAIDFCAAVVTNFATKGNDKGK
jgi:hypothetical protein